MAGQEINCDKCIPAQKVRQLCRDLERMEREHNGFRETDKHQWEEMGRRIKWHTFVWIIALLMSVVTGLLGAIYSQTSATGEKVGGLTVQAARLEEKINAHMKDTRTNNRHKYNPDKWRKTE